MHIEREIEREIQPYLSAPEVVVITGMRRTGKTTLLRSLFRQISSKNKLLLDLENPLNRKYFEEEDYERVRANLEGLGLNVKKRAFLFLDEIQLLTTLPSTVKYLVDHYQLKCFLTGSSSFYLKNLFTESLAGRKVLFELFPLSFREFLTLKGEQIVVPSVDAAVPKAMFGLLSRHYDEYLHYGGFPGVVAKESVSEKKQALEDIFTSYYQHEILQLGGFRKTSVLRDCMQLLLQRIGGKVGVQKLASELGVSRSTVYEYLSFLEATYFINLVKPFSKSRDVTVRGSGKVYVIDSGLAHIIAKVEGGALFEQAVFQVLRRRGEIHFYHRRNAEIDFVLDASDAYEVKLRATEQDVRRTKRLARECGLRSGQVIALRRSELSGVIPGFAL